MPSQRVEANWGELPVVIRALTISQPYADLIASGKKWVENRTWSTDYRGWLAIHAGKGTQYMSAAELRRHTTGAVIAVAQLLACVDVRAIKRGAPCKELYQYSIDGSILTEAAVLNHRHTEGPIAWVLGGVRRFQEPIPCRGAQGLFRWDVPDLVEFAREPTPEEAAAMLKCVSK